MYGNIPGEPAENGDPLRGGKMKWKLYLVGRCSEGRGEAEAVILDREVIVEV